MYNSKGFWLLLKGESMFHQSQRCFWNRWPMCLTTLSLVWQKSGEDEEKTRPICETQQSPVQVLPTMQLPASRQGSDFRDRAGFLLSGFLKARTTHTFMISLEEIKVNFACLTFHNLIWGPTCIFLLELFWKTILFSPWLSILKYAQYCPIPNPGSSANDLRPWIT